MNWPPRSVLRPGDTNLLHESLVDRKKLILPLLHIKLGLMKQFVKTLATDGDCFKYITLLFLVLSVEIIKGDVFDGPQVRQLIKDEKFTGIMPDLQRKILVYHTKTSSRTFLGIHVKVIKQKLFRK